MDGRICRVVKLDGAGRVTAIRTFSPQGGVAETSFYRPDGSPEPGVGGGRDPEGRRREVIRRLGGARPDRRAHRDGWTNAYLYDFHVGTVRFGAPALDDELRLVDETHAPLGGLTRSAESRQHPAPYSIPQPTSGPRR